MMDLLGKQVRFMRNCGRSENFLILKYLQFNTNVSCDDWNWQKNTWNCLLWRKKKTYEYNHVDNLEGFSTNTPNVQN